MTTEQEQEEKSPEATLIGQSSNVTVAKKKPNNSVAVVRAGRCIPISETKLLNLEDIERTFASHSWKVTSANPYPGGALIHMRCDQCEMNHLAMIITDSEKKRLGR